MPVSPILRHVSMRNMWSTTLVKWSQRFINTALCEGTAGEGRGFVLMPSACPYGRNISEDVLSNYQLMVDLAENWGG